MADIKFRVLFSGKLKPGIDPATAQARIQERFKLSDAAIAQLFSGKTVVVKKNLDPDKAKRYQQAFLQAGLIVQLVKQQPAPSPTKLPSSSVASQPEESGLKLAPVDSGPLEPEPDRTPPKVDISYLSLVEGEDWTLEDCDRPPEPIPTPDTSHLSLEEPEPEQDPFRRKSDT